jgi:hypothetical protein
MCSSYAKYTDRQNSACTAKSDDDVKPLQPSPTIQEPIEDAKRSFSLEEFKTY